MTIKNLSNILRIESKGINYDLCEDYFDSVVPIALVKKLSETKNKNKNSEFVEKKQDQME